MKKVKLKSNRYKTSCDVCDRKMGPKVRIWAWTDRRGRKQARCKRHLKGAS